MFFTENNENQSADQLFKSTHGRKCYNNAAFTAMDNDTHFTGLRTVRQLAKRSLMVQECARISRPQSLFFLSSPYGDQQESRNLSECHDQRNSSSYKQAG